MKSTIVFSIFTVLMLLVFAGCGSGGAGQAVQDPAGTASEPVQTVPPGTDINRDGSVTIENQGGSITVAADQSVALPANYPADIFPVYEGSFISAAMKVDRGYSIMALSKDEPAQVWAFYESVLADAKDKMDTRTDTDYMSMGTIGGYTYVLGVVKSTEQGYETTINIALHPAE